jgi:DNA-binding NarL/FixJ family response regulator
MIKILSVDDHALLREGIAALVNEESDMKAGSGTDFGFQTK